MPRKPDEAAGQLDDRDETAELHATTQASAESAGAGRWIHQRISLRKRPALGRIAALALRNESHESGSPGPVLATQGVAILPVLVVDEHAGS